MGNREWVAHPDKCGVFDRADGTSYTVRTSGQTTDGIKTYTFTVPNGYVYELDFLRFDESSRSPGGSATLLETSTFDGIETGFSIQSKDGENQGEVGIWPVLPRTDYGSWNDAVHFALGRAPIVAIKSGASFKVRFNYDVQPTQHDLTLYGRLVKE